MEKEIFERLSKPLLKQIGKNLTTKVYAGFTDYLVRNNIVEHMNEIRPEVFKDYFNEFILWYFGNNNNERLDFSIEVKNELLKRSGGCCTICGTLTIFPQEAENNKSLVIAAACHIKPASKYGPRAEPNTVIDIKEISSIENGLWACMNCHKAIDTECKKYTTDYLKELRNKHVEAILDIKKKKPDIRHIIEALEIRDNSKYVYISLEKFEENITLIKKLSSTQEKMLELYEQLKDLEKNAIARLSIFRMIKELNSKKESIFGKGNLGLKISDDKFIMQVDVKNIDNIQSRLDEFTEQFETEFNYEVMNSGYNTYNKKEEMVKHASDFTKKCEFFILNISEKNLIKIKNDDFKIYPVRNKFNNPSILITKENIHFNSILSISLTKNGNITETTIEVCKRCDECVPDILDFYREFLFIEFIEDFNICNFYFLVRYENIIFEYEINTGIK